MGHNSVISGHPISTRISRVHGLSMGPPSFGVSQKVAVVVGILNLIFLYIFIIIPNSNICLVFLVV